MSDPMVSPQSAVAQLKLADARWEAAIRAFDDYPTRLRTLADAADYRSRALTLAYLANITSKPRPGIGGIRTLTFELSPASDRPGPKALWQQFDQNVAEILQALERGDIQQTARAFGSLAGITRELADACQADVTPAVKRRKSG